MATSSALTHPTPTPLVTLVSYCSHERAFIQRLIANARSFSDLVVVSIGSRLYTGEPENVHDEAALCVAPPPKNNHDHDDTPPTLDPQRPLPDVLVVTYDVPDHLLSQPVCLHNAARATALAAAKERLGFATPFWTLLLDGDEVPDGPRFNLWWTSPAGDALRSNPLTAHKMANHWAFLHPHLVAEQPEDSVLLIHSDLLLHPAALAHPRERDGIYLWHWASPLGRGDALRVQRQVRGLDGDPLFWHYSWVRLGPNPPHLSPALGQNFDFHAAAAALKRKCAAWGHSRDKDWPALIDHALRRAAHLGVWPSHDFVHGHALVMRTTNQGPL